MFRDAYTYLNITPTDLVPIMVDGAISKVTRGWDQHLVLSPGLLSIDPDNPGEKVQM